MTDYRLRPNLESAEETRDRLRRAAEAAEIGTFYCPLPLTRLYWNARCKAHFWLPPDMPDAEIDLETFYRMMHPEDREKTRAAIEACLDHGAAYDVEYRTMSPKGEIRWLRAKGSMSRDEAGRPVRFDGITIDISEQKRLEAERNALMESERMLRVAAQSANRSKDAFIAAVSHELRAPLTSVLAWVDLLAQASDDADFVRNGVSVIRRNVVTQTRLVDDLLDASRMGRGKFTVERARIDVTECFNTALQDIRPIAERKDVFVADLIAEQAYLFGDAPRLRQVFGNLLNNALKHTGAGGKILPSLVRDGHTVRISVADTGAGIPIDRLADIFEPFVQVEDPVSRGQGGLGLGLAIARSIVVMHGGDIAAHSGGQDKGATFTVVLPVMGGEQPSTSAIRGRILERSALQDKTVLLVDDDPDTLQALTLSLSLETRRVNSAQSAAQAREFIIHDRPDVIVSDLSMSGADGYDFISGLRQEGIDIPAIALSGHVREEDEERAKIAGFNEFIRKPVDPAELLEKIDRVIRA